MRRECGDANSVKVVPLSSSSIDSDWAKSSMIPVNHHEICKFSGQEDPRYEEFRNQLQWGFLNDIKKETQVGSRVGDRGVSGRNLVS